VDFGGWLPSPGPERYEAAFRENEIDDKVLLSLTAEDLKDPEDLREVISAYQKCVAETVCRFDGICGEIFGRAIKNVAVL
jgi:SAM domain (Sterile alpha motif)